MTRFRLASPPEPPLAALWDAIVALARDPGWYTRHAVPDTLDGRFDMVALVAVLVLLRLEALDLRHEAALLTERFVEDMDGSLREIGVGDMVVGKHVGRMVGALGGRLGAYRAALAEGEPEGLLAEALARNVYRKTAEQLGEGGTPRLAALARDVRALHARIMAAEPSALLEGRL
jgi:cytochrome b pre-mRNA-processing protein 3